MKAKWNYPSSTSINAEVYWPRIFNNFFFNSAQFCSCASLWKAQSQFYSVDMLSKARGHTYLFNYSDFLIIRPRSFLDGHFKNDKLNKSFLIHYTLEADKLYNKLLSLCRNAAGMCLVDCFITVSVSRWLYDPFYLGWWTYLIII